MASLEIYTPEKTLSLSAFSATRLLQIARPTTKCKFVRQGDTVHLLVFLNDFSGVPFLRVPADALYRAAKRFVVNEQTHRNYKI